ncbi:MAG: hypothetical protein V5A25_13480 [Halovenus sp.]
MTARSRERRRSPGPSVWVGGYFDPLRALSPSAATAVREVPDVAVGLSLVGGFVAGPER